MSPKLRLLPSVDVATLGKYRYLFDRAAPEQTCLSVPIQRVSQRLFDVFKRLKLTNPLGVPQRYDELEALFESAAERAALAKLAQAGYLEPVPDLRASAMTEGLPPAGVPEQAAVESLEDPLAFFREKALKHYFRRPSFFNLPAQIDDDDCDVGLVGVPVSSVLISSGTVAGPARLRRDSQRAGFWFDFEADGVYSETTCDGDLPRILCTGTRLKDFGDLGGDARTVGDLFTELASCIEQRLLPNGVRPLFIGGDHAITFPIVDCYLRHYPDLVLLHLDAHNDLFYSQHVDFNHADPIHGLLAHSGLSRVLSFGLRTYADPRVAPFQQRQHSGLLDGRVKLHSLGALQRWLAQPAAFRQYLKETVGSNTPCYLTIDLDVLSADVMAGQLSTPAGQGLRWHELLETVVHVMGSLNVIAGDIVEFNPDHQDRQPREQREMLSLLFECIDGLSRGRSREVSAAGRVAAPSSPELEQAPRATARRPSLAQAQGGLQAMDRRDGRTLAYLEFLTEYALPGRPVVLTNLMTEWPALSRWSLEYLQAAVVQDETVQVRRFAHPYDFSAMQVHHESVASALRRLAQRRAAGEAPDDSRDYLVNWQFGATCPALLADYTVPAFFTPVLNACLAPATDLRWIFVGEPGSGSAAHIDIFNSSAWLALVTGKKHWRMCAPGQAPRSRAGVAGDLFASPAQLAQQFPGLTIYETEQASGEIVWTPPNCLHAVNNLEHSIAVTQNYLDLSNLPQVYAALMTDAGAANSGLANGAVPLAHAAQLGLDDLNRRGLQNVLPCLREHLQRAFATQKASHTSTLLAIDAVQRALQATPRAS